MTTYLNFCVHIRSSAIDGSNIAVSADQRGLPIIGALCALCGALVAGNVSDIAADLRMRRAAAVAERNLDQAERKWVACLRNAYFLIDEDIYLCDARKSSLTTAQVPEVVGWGG